MFRGEATARSPISMPAISMPATFIPVGTIIANGIGVHQGTVGTALAFTTDNRVSFCRGRLTVAAPVIEFKDVGKWYGKLHVLSGIRLAVLPFPPDPLALRIERARLLQRLPGTALVGRLFIITEPQLVQFAWFARALAWWRATKLRVRSALQHSSGWQAAQRARRRASVWLRRHTRNAR